MNWMRFVNESDAKAVIEIYGTIGGYDYDTWKRINTQKAVQKELNRLKALNTKEIEVRICSYGGFVDHALAIHDALKDHPAKITTVVNSYCASSATIIAMAGDDRKISKNALFLIHHCSSYTGGNDHDLEMELESQRTTNNVIFNIYKEHCVKEDKDLQELFDYNNGKGKWITAQEALDFGFATEIYNETAVPKVAIADRRMLDRLNLPEFPEGHVAEEASPSLLQSIRESIREIIAEFLPTKPQPKENHNNNQTHTEMKKFKAVFACLTLLFAFKADQDYNPDVGHTFTDSEMQDLEKQLQALADLKEAHSKLEADKESADEKLAELTANVETLTAERDDYKTKYENAPASGTPVSGSDAKEDAFQKYIDESPIYKKVDELI